MKLTLVQLHLKYKWLLHGMQAHRIFQFQLRWNPALDYLVIMTKFLCLNKWNIRSLPFFHNIINLTTLFLWVQFPYEITPWNSMPWKLHGVSVDRSSMGRASDRVQKKIGNYAALLSLIMRQERSIMRQIMRFHFS